MTTNDLIASGKLPDFAIRLGIRQRLAGTIAPFEKLDPEDRQAKLMAHIAELKAMPIAIATEEANEQHYELPTAFFKRCLGPHMKYSSGYWDPGVTDIGESETRMLTLTCQRAELSNGQTILELGCGWGSLTLWMAKHYPDSKITTVSNSRTQREYIMATAKERGLSNIQVITCDMNKFDPAEHNIRHGFDRVVSVEMFEHMKNYRLLLAHVAMATAPALSRAPRRPDDAVSSSSMNAS